MNGVGTVDAGAAAFAKRILEQLELAHRALLQAGLAFTAGEAERAAAELDDVAVLTADIAADLRAASERAA